MQDFIIDVQKKFQLGDHSESMREFENDREAIAALLRGFGLLSAEDSNATRVRPADIAAVSAFRKRFRDRLSDAKRALELVHEAIALGKQNHAQNPNGVFVYLSVDTYGKLPNDKSCYLCYDADAGEWADRYHAVPLLPKPVANVNEVAVDDEAAFEEFRASVLEALLQALRASRRRQRIAQRGALV